MAELARRYRGLLGILIGPARNLYVGTQSLFQASKVVPQTAHSKLLI
jgi:hypothetical protein